MIKNILTQLKIEKLNAMQEASLDAWKEGKDLILLSPTGSGKTLAYLLPLLQSLKPDVKGVQAVVLVPSRELALQIDQVFKSMNTPFKAVSCYGGRPAMEEHRTLKGVQPSVIIATPGRMNDHLSKQNFDAATVTTLVIDEFDKCLEFGFQEEMATVIGQLPGLRRRFLLSATDADEIPQFTGLNRTVRLDFLSAEGPLAGRLHIYKVMSPEKDKLETLYKLLCCLGDRSTLVFCNHRESVERVGKFLLSQKMQCGIFHGGMEQDDRERSLYKFRNGSCHVLISTDLAARGLDIPEIENVVHYHLPANEDGYVHRNGRTARWESEGNSYVILHAAESLPAYMNVQPEEFVLPEIPPKPSLPQYVTLYIGKGKKDKINKIDIVGFLFKKGNLNKDEIGRIDVKDHYSFAAVSRKKIKQTLNLIRNEKIKGVKTLIEEAK
ncbi:DEAD/DEAH box helicase [Phocaeicola sp.]|uniref:DEAD/DEAH box helicase n=1 Tax=Phocaeicola sp. TaxID=2773926 RepID=UPI0023D291D3|nr:DEAD/DEAH box helicase [Phocaeicola sp.]MDE5676795.1 DEAD/DEAH box helicase [Phocaeicola sp.]